MLKMIFDSGDRLLAFHDLSISNFNLQIALIALFNLIDISITFVNEIIISFHFDLQSF